MWRTETGRERLCVVGTPIPRSGLAWVDLEPRRKRVLCRHGARGRAVLVRNRSQDVLQGELIPRGELGDNLVMNPWGGTLQGQRSDISVVGGPKIVLWDGG